MDHISSMRLFESGKIVATPAALESLEWFELPMALNCHLGGNWGDLSDEDKKRNNDALAMGGRILSAYRSLTGIRFWIITEADRSYTTVLLPQDY